MTFNIGFYAYAIIGHTRADQLLPQLLMEQFDTFLYNVDTWNICMKEFGFCQNDSCENLDNISLIGLCICIDGAFMGRSTPTTAFDGAI